MHSHIDHLLALLELAGREGMAEPRGSTLHGRRDARRTPSEHDLAELPLDRIATVCGRYYAMDRDGRWRAHRSRRGRNPLGRESIAPDPLAAIRTSYGRGVTDEFVEPIVVDDRPRLGDGDAAVFFNFRPDRTRQLSQRLLEAGVDLTTMTRYSADFACPVAFGEQDVASTLAEVLATHGLRQLHAAETEKYAHVTYFFNGGEEREWEGETRILVPSPRDVASYDLKPEMSAERSPGASARSSTTLRFAVVNFANPDMVGHTGAIPAAVAAVEATDRALGKVVDRVAELGGVCLVTADHGNAEVMLERTGSARSPRTRRTGSRSSSPTPASSFATRVGCPTSHLPSWALLDVPIPADMTGSRLATPA